MSKKPRLDFVMHLSTAHLTADDCEKLSNPLHPDCAHFIREEGYVVWTEWKGQEDLFLTLSPAFHACMSIANEMKAAWVMFDRDEEVWENGPLEVFDW